MARFLRRGVTKFKFVPTIAAAANADGSPNNPTRPEITAGTDLTPQVTAFDGFDLTNNKIDTPDFVSTFDSNIAGTDSAGDPSITFYEDDTANPLRTTLAKGTAGYLYICPTGDTLAKPTEIWPVRVSNNSRMFENGNESAKWKVQFSITARPNQAGVAVA